MRVAFPDTFVSTPFLIVLDVIIDAFDLSLLLAAWRSEHTTRTTATANDEPTVPVPIARRLLVIVALHVGRATYLLLGTPWVWYVAQAIRCQRVLDMMKYMGEMSADLTTNVNVLASYKFALILFSVPHWISAVWWLLARDYVENPTVTSPSWAAQVVLFSGNPELDPVSGNDGLRYLHALYMSWSGMTAMGYAMTLASMEDLIFAIVVCAVQVVFYAFVLGTLFHYLVRTDENTAHFKELLKALDQYSSKRSLPPRLAARIHAYFQFQHKKRASGADKIFAQVRPRTHAPSRASLRCGAPRCTALSCTQTVRERTQRLSGQADTAARPHCLCVCHRVECTHRRAPCLAT